MPASDSKQGRRKKMLRGTLIIGLGTLLSRLLGMFRDAATAAMLGMSVGGIMDSFVLAFRLPDIARRLFGDGTLSISFIPVFTNVWQQDQQKAWSLLSVMLAWVFLFLTGFVILGEILCGIGFTFFHPDSKVYLTAHLLALLLPYLILICMAAITSATLQTLGHFSLPAAIPLILNIIWLLGILLLAPYFTNDPALQCYLLTLCILVAGVIQFFIHFPFLKAYGFHLDLGFSNVAKEIRQIFHGFFPQLFGLMSMQLNILSASGIAWLFTGSQEETIRWLGRFVTFPMRSGAVSAIYYSERLYEFPQGLIGLAIATAIYPLLSQHAARKNFAALGEDLSLGLRIQFVLSIPAGVGLMLMSEKLAHLLFQRGAFTPDDMARTADLIFWFGSGVWAFCSLPIVVRAFYVLGDIWIPFRIGLMSCVLNLVLGLLLIWHMEEQGLALAASIAAGSQSLVLFLIFVKKYRQIDIKSILLVIIRSSIATFSMALMVAIQMKSLPGESSVDDVIHIVFGGIVGIFVYAVVYRFLGGRELGILLRGRVKKKTYRQRDRKRQQKKER
ncbi:MAG: murein biosynthesis integral membrane protein MurJ [Planctomycetaceae bacterium]|jgi:putative peptidoglycan lipid II flippase|nr:murein biosynthesis integral membrane protein MurJ [Planctomycetaceae bacterium]